jgi:hypothetical protein
MNSNQGKLGAVTVEEVFVTMENLLNGTRPLTLEAAAVCNWVRRSCKEEARRSMGHERGS